MDIQISSDLTLKNNEAALLFVGQKQNSKGDKKSSKELIFSKVELEADMKALLDLGKDAESITGAYKEAPFFRHSINSKNSHFMTAGLGSPEKFTAEILRNALAEAIKKAQTHKVSRLHVLFDSLTEFSSDEAELARAAAEAATLVGYTFNDFKSTGANAKGAAKKPAAKPFGVTFVSKNSAKIKASITFGETLAECINFAKRLGDTPGNYMTPPQLAADTQKAARGTKLKVQVWTKERIKKEKMGGLLGVALGGGPDPRFIIMEYKGAGPGQKPIAFVGKGLTFDTGGISIKPAAAMDEMKFDMCGGANVIATMLALAKLKIKVNAVGYVPSTENMSGPMATKPGDILTARNGKTVEVLNTDAEGRLILMDALAYATEQKPQAIFDAATLTGAMVVALSNIHTGFFTKDDKLAAKIEAAAKDSGELVWRMPLVDHHLSDMKGSYADLQNIGKKSGAGSATAAAFLSEFVDPEIPWAHFDIAGTAWNCSDRLSYCSGKGATGVMVRTFVEIAQSFAK